MRRNARTRAIAPETVLALMNAAIDAVCARLPGERRESVERVVYEVATELVSTVTDPDRLATMLRLRATARLTAATGHLTPIRSTTELPTH
jgi:hypothetical protein